MLTKRRKAGILTERLTEGMKKRKADGRDRAEAGRTFGSGLKKVLDK